jgi:hypothetical protein
MSCQQCLLKQRHDTDIFLHQDLSEGGLAFLAAVYGKPLAASTNLNTKAVLQTKESKIYFKFATVLAQHRNAFFIASHTHQTVTSIFPQVTSFSRLISHTFLPTFRSKAPASKSPI